MAFFIFFKIGIIIALIFRLKERSFNIIFQIEH